MSRLQKAWESCQWQETLGTEWLDTVSDGSVGIVPLITSAVVEGVESESFSVLRIVGQIGCRASTLAGGAAAQGHVVKLRVGVGMQIGGTTAASGGMAATESIDEFMWERAVVALPGASTAAGRNTVWLQHLDPTRNPWWTSVDIRVSRRLTPPQFLFLSAQTFSDAPVLTDIISVGGWLRCYRGV